VQIPNFWDSRRKIDPPNLGSLSQIRFLTENDYPPFHFQGPDGQITGFEIDLAREICEQLKVTCSIQPVRWDGLTEALARGQGDAIMAAMRISAEARGRFQFTSAYFRSPARFVSQRSGGLASAEPSILAGRRVAVAERSQHEAFLKAFFGKADRVTFRTASEALEALRGGEVDAAFVDGTVAAFWLNGEASGQCCAFLGQGFTEPRYFGEGAGIAVRLEATALRQALDWALHRIAAEGIYAKLYLKYFPVSIY